MRRCCGHRTEYGWQMADLTQTHLNTHAFWNNVMKLSTRHISNDWKIDSIEALEVIRFVNKFKV